MRIALLLTSVVALSACAVATETADTAARNTAKSVVNDVVTEKFPGVDASPITDCVIDNATTVEIFAIAKAGVTGVTPSTVEAVTTIVKRPDTVSCISKNGLGLFL